MNEFDWIVIGEQPGGLFLLERLLQEQGAPSSLKIGWVRLGEPCFPIAVPHIVATQMGLSLEESWSAEIHTPTHSWVWDSRELQTQYRNMGVEFRPNDPGANLRTSLTAQLFRRDPDLYLRLQTLWTFLGVSDELSEERLLVSLAPCTQLVWWNPANRLTVAEERIQIADVEPNELKMEITRSHTMLDLGQGERWKTSQCLWNTSIRRTSALLKTQPVLAKTIPSHPNINSSWGLCPIEVRLGPLGVPAHVPPLIFYVAADGIVDRHREVWPIEVHRLESETLLRIWISVRQPISVDTIIESAQRAVGEMRRLFPYFDETLQSIWPPLFVGDCCSDTDRTLVTKWFESSFRENYRLSALHLEARTPGFRVLTPNFECHLPHPAGPLRCAKKIMEDWKRAQDKKRGRLDRGTSPYLPS